MTGFRTGVQRVEIFSPKDRVVTASGRRGHVAKVWLDSADVIWDDGERFWIKLVHLSHEERFFGGETSRRPGG